jgi:uncharacterized protein (DUF433 family)
LVKGIRRIIALNMAALRKDLVVRSDPDILGGTPVFVGTRVPARILFEHLEAGDSLEVFLEQFPSVSREQAVAALELAREVLTEDARTA